MKKNELKEAMKSMTMSEVLDALNAAVDSHNVATDSSSKVTAKDKIKKLSEQYNEMAKLTAYAEALKAEIPVSAIVKKHHYSTRTVQYKPIIDIVEGKPVAKEVASVKTGNKNVDLFDFIAWAEAKNKKVTAETNWKSVMNAQREIICKAFDKAVSHDSDYNVSKTMANDVLQAVFNAIIFVPGESGKNSVFPNKDCKNLIIACGAEYKETITDTDDVNAGLHFLKDKKWKSLVQSALFLVLQNKTLTISFGDPEAEANEAAVTDGNSEEATTEATVE